MIRGGVVVALAKKHPDKIGMLNTPNSFKKPYGKWGFDNGCFTNFNEKAYFGMLENFSEFIEPMFVVVPDVVGCFSRTLALWNHYYHRIKSYGYPLAFVVQDGCRPTDVPALADWIFVGGLDPWKIENIHKFIGDKPVHVGRVNSVGRAKYCESLGVKSVDGTRWWTNNYKKLIGMFEVDRQRGLFNAV